MKRVNLQIQHYQHSLDCDILHNILDGEQYLSTNFIFYKPQELGTSKAVGPKKNPHISRKFEAHHTKVYFFFSRGEKLKVNPARVN